MAPRRSSSSLTRSGTSRPFPDRCNGSGSHGDAGPCPYGDEVANREGTTEPIAPHTDRILGFAENLVYALAGALLVGASIAVLGAEAFHYVTDLTEGVKTATTALLDGLLLVFILLELLAGVRATMIEKRLVAEPFLVVGIIASIKEIIVTALEAQAGEQGQRAFENSMIEVGVLGGLVVLLALASFLVRRKEREPTE